MLVDSYLNDASFDAAGQWAADLEGIGFDGVWAPEAAHDPFLSLLLASGTTTRVELGTSVAIAFARSPMTAAMTANDLQLAAKGRFVLGLGTQLQSHIERRFSMPWGRPAHRMREFILALRAIWACWNEGERLAFAGEFYHHDLMLPLFNPGPNPFGPPKVFLAAVGPRMTEVAGEVADGILIHPFVSSRYLADVTLPAIERGLKKAGRARSSFEVSYSAMLVTGGDAEETQRGLAGTTQRIAFYAGTPTYRPVMEHHGWGAIHDELVAIGASTAAEARKARTALINDDVLNAFAILADPPKLAAAVHDRLGGTVDRFGLMLPHVQDLDWVAPVVAGIRSA
jgi:probable F420-dependent oxidoreductase